MPVGIEYRNESGYPIMVTDDAWQFFAHDKGVIYTPTSGGAAGTSGGVALPVQRFPYLVFVRCPQGAAQAFGSRNGFSWRVGINTPYFEWWAYRPAGGGGREGIQTFNSDGSVKWDCTERPLRIVSCRNIGGQGGVPSFTETSPENMQPGPYWEDGRTDLAYAISDLGMCHDVYAYSGGGPTVRANMRYQPHIHTVGTGVRLDYYRTRVNRVNSPGGNVSYTAFRSRLPNWLLAARTW